MAATVIDFEGMQLTLPVITRGKSISCTSPHGRESFYVGQLVDFKLQIPISKFGLEKMISWSVKRSPNSMAKAFVREILSILEIKSSLDYSDDCKHPNIFGCAVLNSYDESDSFAKGNEPVLADGHTFIMPLQVRIIDIPQNCDNVQLHVEVRTMPKRVPDWLSSPSKSSHDHKQEVPECRYRKLEKVLKIIHTPVVSFHQKTVAGKHLIVLKVSNTSSCRLWIVDCAVMPESYPKMTDKQTCGTCKHLDNPTESRCVVHGNLVRPVATSQSTLPADLRPGESLSLVYMLHLNTGKESLTKEDISLVAHLKWNIWARRHEASVTTTYSLPVLKLKQAHFVMTASCDVEKVYKGHSFTVTYSIRNLLQDFLALRLMWNPVAPRNVPMGLQSRHRSGLKLYQWGHSRSMMCFIDGMATCVDPDHNHNHIQPYCTARQQVCKHMKINLRYAMPGSGPASQVESPASLAKSIVSDDQLLSASEEVWRDRRGSGSSFNDPNSIPAAERRLSFANKSYSVGDLAPILSTDSDKLKHTSGNKLHSPKLGGPDRARSPTSSQYEHMLLNPANFIKNSYKVLVH